MSIGSNVLMHLIKTVEYLSVYVFILFKCTKLCGTDWLKSEFVVSSARISSFWISAIVSIERESWREQNKCSEKSNHSNRQNKQKQQCVQILNDGTVCNRIFCSTSALNSHFKRVHKGIRWICPLCNDEHTSKDSLQRNLGRKHCGQDVGDRKSQK